MGGASGHLQHVAEDPDITFGEIKDIISLAAEGKLESVTEKLDGVNIMFTFNPEIGGVKLARNSTDIKNGGITPDELTQRLKEKPGAVGEAFAKGSMILDQSLKTLPPKVSSKIFNNGKRWFSAEIIYSGLPMTINYDNDHVVFHRSPIFDNVNGKLEPAKVTDGVDTLEKNIKAMQNAVKQKSWQIHGPAVLQLKKLTDGSIAPGILSQIDALTSQYGLSDSDTIGDYLYNRALSEVKKLGIKGSNASEVAKRLAKVPGAPTMVQLKSKLSPELYEQVKTLAEDKTLHRTWLAPIERAVHKLAVAVLSGIHSVLIQTPDKEVKRLSTTLSGALSKLSKVKDPAVKDKVSYNLERLGGADINTTLEGIVFMYKGRAYKLTGLFAAFHKIISLMTFGNVELSESARRRSHARLLSEGGHAFSNVTPIKLETLKENWDDLIGYLESKGVEDIRAIGSTLKKAVSGDVDLAGAYPGNNVKELKAKIESDLGQGQATLVGSRIVSMAYQLNNGEHVQVDLMVGDPNYLEFARAGTSDIPGHEHYSRVKGVIRNVLFNTITNQLALQSPKTYTDLDRERDSIDFDVGIRRVKQTRRGEKIDKETGQPIPLKSWKTLQSELITSDPEELLFHVFGKRLKKSDVSTFEKLVDVVRTSPKTKKIANKILDDFADNLRTIPSLPEGSAEKVEDYLTGLK